MFLKLNKQPSRIWPDGEIIWLQSLQIAAIERSLWGHVVEGPANIRNEGSLVVLSDGLTYHIKQSPDEIVAMTRKDRAS